MQLEWSKSIKKKKLGKNPPTDESSMECSRQSHIVSILYFLNHV